MTRWASTRARRSARRTAGPSRSSTRARRSGSCSPESEVLSHRVLIDPAGAGRGLIPRPAGTPRPIHLARTPGNQTRAWGRAMKKRAVVLALLGWAAACLAFADEPVGWRNDGSGRFPAAKPPSEWSSDKNVLWKVSLPGHSYGSPVVVGDNLYVASDPSDLLCVRRSDGKVLWKKSHSDVKAPAAKGGGKGGPKGGGKGGGGMGGRSAGNSAATPVSDGKHVAVLYGNGVAAAYDLEGKRLWARHVESSSVGFGHSASPLLLGGKLIVHVKDLVA